MDTRSTARLAIALVTFAAPFTTGTAHATAASDVPTHAAGCYAEAVFRLAQPLDGEPSDTRFHSVGTGTARCAGLLGGRSIDPAYGEFTASGAAQSTSCQSGTGSFHGHLRLRSLAGEPIQVPVRVSFTRVGLTGHASGELVADGTPLKGAFAAQPVSGDCANTPVDEVRIRVAVEIGA